MLPGRWVGEDARAIDDLRVLRRRERHLDHVDAEERGVRILLGLEARAARELLAGAHGAGARAVDVDVRLVVRIGDQRVRVRAAAGLHRRDLLRLLEVGDVEDADAAEALGAHRRLRRPAMPQSMRPRVCSTDMNSRLPWTETSPWPPGQTIEASSLRPARVLDVVGVEPVEVAEEHVRAAEREVGVGEVEAAAAAGAGAPAAPRAVAVALGAGARRSRGAAASHPRRLRLAAAPLRACGRSGGIGSPAGAFGSKNPSGLGSVATSSMLRAATPASLHPGLEPDARIVRGAAGASAARPARTTPRDDRPRRTHTALTALISFLQLLRASRPCDRFPCADRRPRRTRTRRCPLPARRRGWRTVPPPSSARRRGA